MKKQSVFVPALVIIALVAMMADCASTRTQSITGELVDDTVITTKIKSMLAADAFLKSFQISVETFQGTVQLSGFVDSRKAADRASEIVKSVQGVKNVKNNLIVK